MIDRERIRASIEVYDFVDGREVNRRPAYPMARVSLSFREAAERARGAFRNFGEALERMKS